MKSKLMLLWLLAIASIVNAQTTLTLRPNATEGKDAWVVSNVSGVNYGNSPNYAAISWTSGGAFNSRSLISFNLSSIPSNAVISDAKLSLYCNTTSDHPQLHSGSNSCYLERITASWSENTVNWFNQPSTTTTNRVTLPASSSQTQNYPDINVTSLVQDMVSNPSTSHGFMIKLVTEAAWRSLIFASSDHGDSSRWPKLVVTYTVNSISLVKPVSTDTLYQNFSFPITYATSGTGNIKIEYSTNLSTWNTIDFSVNPVTGFYNWTPQFSANQCWIKISSESNPQLSSTNIAPFRILSTPTITITNPNNGGTFFIGDTLPITWISNNIKQFVLEYKSGQGQWLPIANNLTGANGTFKWVLPNISSQKVNIRARAILPVAVTHQADSSIRIAPKPTFNLINPNGMEVWLNHTSQYITWQSTFSPIVKLHYSINGNNWISIADSVPNTNNYQWNLPQINSKTVRVKVSDWEFPQFMDTTQNVFTIKSAPSINLTYPVNGETLFQGDTCFISWDATYSDNLNIQYSTDNGNSWTTIDSLYPSGLLSYAWKLPFNINSKTVKIKLSDREFPSYISINTNPFSILPKPNVLVTNPNTRKKWVNNSTQAITWIASNSDFVNIYYSDNQANWILIKDSVLASLGTYNWALPSISKDSIWIKISDRSFPQFHDVNNEPVKIVPPPVIDLLSPDGGERYYVGSNKTITWTSTSSSHLRIELCINNNNCIVINDSISSSIGSFNWLVPNAVSTTARIKITDLDFPEYVDSSLAYFEILQKPTVTLLSPNGGENFTSGNTQSILWNSTNMNSVSLYYTTNGSSWTLIDAAANATSGNYSWQVPTVSSLTCKIKIVDNSDTSINDESNANFRISPFMSEYEIIGNNFSTYPNPVKIGDKVYLKSTGNMNVSSVTLLDITGRKINELELVGKSKTEWQYLIPDNYSINAGTYLIQIHSAEGISVRKIIIKE